MPSNTNSQISGPKKPSKHATSKTTAKTGVAKGIKPAEAQANPAQNVSSLKELSVQNTVTAVQEFIDATNQLRLLKPELSMNNVSVGVNKKKQKRRQKQAARLAAEKPQSQSSPSQGFACSNDIGYHDIPREVGQAHSRAKANGFDYGASDYDDAEQDEPVDVEDRYYTDDEGRLYHNKDTFNPPRTNGHDHIPSDPGSKPKKKKKNKPPSLSQRGYPSNHNPANTAPLPNHAVQHPPPPPPPPPPPLSIAALRSAHHISKDRIWNTSTAEERERIKEFWLSLGEEDRRSLVKVEKEAVLKKMKEQQKHSCSCTVCGRKRTAIEEELEGLYDAYYEELEQYANHQHINLDDGTPMIPHPRMYAHPMARMPPSRNPQVSNSQRLPTGRVQEVEDDGEGEDEEYSDEDEDDILSEEEPEELPPGPAADFFNFGNSLTVQGGILTVADDLLKNDGKKFIEMMEQLAERRMQREEEAQHAAAGIGHGSTQPHNQGAPAEEDEYDDDEDDEEYDSQEDEEYDDDEMETLTEEQRMEEGRRMFQIFAARMFEQRVLTAYREKVANERQQKLLEELEEESRLDTQREAKKAKEAQKKKDKKRLQKQAKDEEKAKREAEKAAEEAEAKVLEEKKAEEQRQKREEQRKRKEAEKKAQDEERQRKEVEKQKRAQEAREQQAELERKQREQKERDKKKRDELKKKEREEREAKEREAKERKERDAAEKKGREAKAKAAQEGKERNRKEEQTVKRTLHLAPPTSPAKHHVPLSAIPVSSAFYPPQTASNQASPRLQIATPAVPKSSTPIRPRQTSFQSSHNSSPKTSQAPSGSSTTPPALPLPQSGIIPIPGKLTVQTPILQPVVTPTFPPINGPPTAISQPPGFSGMPAMGGNNFPLSQGPMLPPIMQRAQMHEPMMHQPHQPHPHQSQFNPNQYRNFMPANGLSFPPGMNGMRPLVRAMDPPPSHASTIPVSSANVGQYMSRDTMPRHSHSHSRNTSASASFSTFDIPSTPTQTQPIARPTPIHRPSSVAPNQQSENPPTAANSEMEDLSNHLGSSALLDDSDIPLASNPHETRHASMAPGVPLSGRHGFNASPMFPEAANQTKIEPFPRVLQGSNGNTWSAQPMPFGPGMSSPPKWPALPANGWNATNHFGIIGGSHRPAPRAVTLRLLICRAWNKLQNTPPVGGDRGFHSVDAVLREVELMKPANEGHVSLKELLEICETEGNAQNGGGAFKVEAHEPKGLMVKYDLVKFDGRKMSVVTKGTPGEIGSPVQPASLPGLTAAMARYS